MEKPYHMVFTLLSCMMRDQTQVVEDIYLPLTIPSYLAPRHQEHSRDLPIDLEPLIKFSNVVNGEEGVMSLGCDLSEIEAKPGDHGKEKGGK